MHGEGFFFQAFVFLAAAVIVVPLAKRFGFGSVLGYLVAGVAIGPFGLGLVGEEGQDVMHFAEFGVVMMLFLIGLEVQPSRLWRLRGPILGLGGLQVGLTAVALGALALALGLSWRPALAIGLTLALSSTALVLQSLQEKGLETTRAGESAFSVLLFQDIAVIPILALFPLLGTGVPVEGEAAHGSTNWLVGLPGWAQTLVVVGAVAAIFVAGRYLLRPVFRLVAATRLRELFTAAALLLIIAIALLMTKVGLSPALGTFLAGVLLANSEYRHALESDIEPFKGLLLGLFFLAVGAGIDFHLIGEQPGTIAGLVAGLVVVKLVLLVVLGRVFGLGLDQNLLFAFALAQAGEFAFVLLSYAVQEGVFARAVAAPLTAVVAISMALTPLVMLFAERLLLPRVGTREKVDRPADAIEERNPVIIAGFGRFGSIVGRFLRSHGIATTVLDIDSDHVDVLRRLGYEVYYGDASREDLLRAAGADDASVLIIAVDDPESIRSIAASAQKHFPNLRILARARSRTHAYDLLDSGIDRVYRETFDTSLRAGIEALRLLGVPGYAAHRRARTFRRFDEAHLRDLAQMRHDRKAYFLQAREQIEELERVISADRAELDTSVDEAWDAAPLRAEAAESSE